MGDFQCFGYASLKDSFFIDVNYATVWHNLKCLEIQLTMTVTLSEIM